MKREIICPRCGKETFYVYRGERSGVFAGCEHCVEPLDRDYAAYDAKCHPEDYAPPKVRCPVCGEPCRKIYRKMRYFDIVGCEHCLIELDPDSDSSIHPGDYGLPDPYDEEAN